MNIDRFELSIGEDMVTARERGQSTVRTAAILGRQSLPDGRVRVWLDRRIHPGGDVTLRDGAILSGAISTIITMPASQLQA